MLTSKEIRQKYLDFMESKGHAVIPGSSLLPENDSSTLFTGSGMQPLLPYLLGEKHPEGTRLVDSQKCFRAEDIEEVGDNRHNTFFEMLGNWSLGDYFKEEQLMWIWEFLTKELELDPHRIYVTVFRGNPKIDIEKDKDSVQIWKELFTDAEIEAKDIDLAEEEGMKGGRIFYYDESKNWWSRVGVSSNMPIGEPGGPDSEIFYDLDPENKLKIHESSDWKNKPCHVNCDCGRFIEIGNNVFMEYIKTENGFKKLEQKNVDFGGGLERLTMAVQEKDNVFETDLFANILSIIRRLSGGKIYQDNMKAFEVIADHLKAATFIMASPEKIVPSNTDQGYVVRRLIRRAIRYGRYIGINQKEPWTKEIAKIVAHDYGLIYPEVQNNINYIIEELNKEEKKFANTLEKGLKKFEELGGFDIDGKAAFDLYQTYGFPIEMTEELATERGRKVDKEGFDKELAKHQELSRTASAGKFKGGLADQSEKTKKLHTAAHLLLAALRKVLGNHVEQKGSNITAERLRFDFSHPEKLTDEEKNQVEDMVNDIISKNLPVECIETSLEEAKKSGAVGVFESKYGDKVKVYQIKDGDDYFSNEICGGPHVEKTGELGEFKIKKEQSSSAGVRRIKAVLN